MFRNCSTAVAQALTAGGGANFAGMWARNNVIWTPDDVANYATAILRGMQLQTDAALCPYIAPNNQRPQDAIDPVSHSDAGVPPSAGVR